MPRRQSFYDLVDKNLDGRLDALLREWRDDGLTFEGIAHELRTEHEITLTGETVRNWCTRLGIHAPAGDAA